jgi:hypothetical protein
VELLLPLGLAVTKMLLRAADKQNVADSIGDAQQGWAALRALRRPKNALEQAITNELKRHLRATSGKDQADLRYAGEEVTNLLNDLADDDTAVTVAGTSPDTFFDYAKKHYAKKHGGDQKRRLMSERAALAFDRILEVACDQFARLAPSSSRFVSSACRDCSPASYHRHRCPPGSTRIATGRRRRRSTSQTRTEGYSGRGSGRHRGRDQARAAGC